jgi:hypothetical protein
MNCPPSFRNITGRSICDLTAIKSMLSRYQHRDKTQATF